MLEIRKVDTAKDLMEFIKLPFRLYKDDPQWVPPLMGDQKKYFSPATNPYFQHSEVALFLALKDGKTVGRITAQTNTEHNREHKDKVGFFGFLECENEHEIANILLDTAAQWNKEHGMDTVRGPMNFSTNDECGLLIEGFDTPPFIMMTHHLPYYGKLMEQAGFSKIMDLYAYYLDAPSIPERLEKAAKLIEKRGNFTVRTIRKDKKLMREDIATIFKVYRKAWAYNWGYVPVTEGEFDHLVKTLLPIVDFDLVFIAEIDGKPVGFSLAMPNFNEVLKVMKGHTNPITMVKALIKSKHIKSLRVITMGVIKEYQNRGIDIIFYYLTFVNGFKRGIHKGEFSWILENNMMMNRMAEMLGSHIHKTYRIYDRKI